MYTLSIENERGDRLQLSQNPDYTVTSVTGLNPPTANINTAVNASFDGSTYKSSRVNNRNIVIMLAIEGDIEKNRINLYKYVKSKKRVTLYFANGSREVHIDGYVENFDINLFEQRQMAQISIICPNPFFMDAEDETVLASVIGLFEFPFSIPEEGVEFSRLETDVTVDVINDGDVETGMRIVFRAHGEVVNPALYNMETNEFIKLNVTMEEGDEIQISTVKGKKGVVEVSGGVTTNILNVLTQNSTWLSLLPGDNLYLFTADATPENLTCTIYHDNLYEGV